MSITSQEYQESRLRKGVEDSLAQYKSLEKAIELEREKWPNWKNLRDGPDGKSYGRLRAKVKEITIAAGGQHAACQDRKASRKICRLARRIDRLEEHYGCFDRPSIPLVIKLLREAGAWIELYLPNSSIGAERGAEKARTTLAPIRNMIRTLWERDSSLPKPPLPHVDPQCDLESLRIWADDAQISGRTPEPPETITVREAAIQKRVTESTVYKRIADGTIATLPGSKLPLKSSVDAYHPQHGKKRNPNSPKNKGRRKAKEFISRLSKE